MIDTPLELKMRTVETLCKSKDVVTLVYKHLHRMHTKDMIQELKLLLSFDYHDDVYGAPFVLLFRENAFMFCFNHRSNEYGRKGDHVIHHISHKTHQTKATNARTISNYF